MIANPRRRILLSLVVLSVIGSGCAGSKSEPGVDFASPSSDTIPSLPQTPPAPNSSAATSLSSSEAAKMLDFKAPKVGGGQVSGNDYLGKDVAAWIWAPW